MVTLVPAVIAVCVACGAAPVGAGRVGRTAEADAVMRGKVVRVVDGDTLDVRSGSRTYRVRLLGLDAAEVAHDGRPAQCGAGAARVALDRLVSGREVVVRGDPVADRQDRFGRLLGYVEVDGSDVGARLVAAGRAGAWHPRDSVSPGRYEDYARAAADARAGGVGGWGECGRQGR